MEIKQSARKLWIDALRGIAMLLVVYGHCVRGWTEFFVFTSPVKMPLFFVISGYLFNPRGGDIIKFLQNTFLKLIVPWLLLGMFPFTHPAEQFLSLLSGNTLWFMPCFIIGEIIWFFIHKFSKKDGLVAICAIIACVAGFTLSHFHVLRFAMIDTAFIVQIFFLLGFMINKYEQYIIEKWKLIIIGNALVYSILGGVLCGSSRDKCLMYI